ncbi:MAG: zf-HC2 domain-containing protein [Endomicrobiales bacterium]|nr:zf-HC2 domain-containing protein [Endomicrobiales bacterium]
MNCKKIKELLLTDYADGCIKANDSADLNEHLLACAQCNAYKEKLFSNVINPLRVQARVQVPSYLQAKVRSAVYVESSKRHSVFSVFSFLRGWRGVASMCGLFMIALILMYTPNKKVENISDEHINYLTETIYGESLQANTSESLNFGTAVETYLL